MPHSKRNRSHTNRRYLNKSYKKRYRHNSRKKSYKLYPKRGGSRSSRGQSYRSQSAQRGRYQSSKGKGSSLTSQSSSSLASGNVSKRVDVYREMLTERHAKKEFDSFKAKTELVKTMLDKMIEKQATNGIYVDKIHLNNAWENATKEYRKKNYFKESQPPTPVVQHENKQMFR